MTLTTLLFLSPALAITTRDDVDGAEYVDWGAGFGSVGWFADGDQPYCTATLVAPDRALTAAHCVDDDFDGELDWPAEQRGVFNLGPDIDDIEVSVAVIAVQAQPEWSAGARDPRAWDVALLTLESPVDSVAPMPWAGADVTGERAVVVGYGVTSDGLSPDWREGDKRAAENVVDGLDDGPGGTGAWLMDFDDPTGSSNTISQYYGMDSDPDPLPLEGTPAPGDSGGPMFVEIDGAWHVVGVISGGGHPAGGSEDEMFLYGGIAEMAVLMDPANADWLTEQLDEVDPGGDTGDTGWGDTGEPAAGAGCGCAASPGAPGWLGLLLPLLVASRRR